MSSAKTITEYDLSTRHDLEDLFDSMRECFQDKETEQNWTKRDLAITKLRRVTIGNSPTDFKDTYLAGIKSLLEGIIKAINSLVCLISFSRRTFPIFLSSVCPLHFPHPCVSGHLYQWRTLPYKVSTIITFRPLCCHGDIDISNFSVLPSSSLCFSSSCLALRNTMLTSSATEDHIIQQRLRPYPRYCDN